MIDLQFKTVQKPSLGGIGVPADNRCAAGPISCASQRGQVPAYPTGRTPFAKVDFKLPPTNHVTVTTITNSRTAARRLTEVLDVSPRAFPAWVFCFALAHTGWLPLTCQGFSSIFCGGGFSLPSVRAHVFLLSPRSPRRVLWARATTDGPLPRPGPHRAGRRGPGSSREVPGDTALPGQWQ